jgi:hypothetical protein
MRYAGGHIRSFSGILIGFGRILWMPIGALVTSTIGYYSTDIDPTDKKQGKKN